MCLCSNTIIPNFYCRKSQDLTGIKRSHFKCVYINTIDGASLCKLINAQNMQPNVNMASSNIIC